MSSKWQEQADKRQRMKLAIERLQQMDPARYAELLKRARDTEYDARVQRAAFEEQERKREEARRLAELEKAGRFSKPVIATLPVIPEARGMVAFRVWNYDGFGLASTAMRYHWKEVNFADSVPTRSNNHGLYCIKLTGLGVLTTGANYFGTGRQNVSGFIELLGDVVEHTDGVLRAEVARLICLFVTSENEHVSTIIGHLYEQYPVTPVFVLNPEQLADVVMREVLKQRYVRGQT